MSEKSELLKIYEDVFEPELIKELEEKSKLINAKAGEAMIEVGQQVLYMPIVLKGIIKVSRIDENGNELLLYYVEAAESCAMTFTCCMREFPSEISAVVDEDSEILMIPTEYMYHWIVRYPSWKNFVMRTIRNRFHELIVALDQIAFQSLDERLSHYLKVKYKTTGSALINLSHEQIANDLASSRVVISRLLKRLENDKKVLLYRNQIKLLHAFIEE